MSAAVINFSFKDAHEENQNLILPLSFGDRLFFEMQTRVLEVLKLDDQKMFWHDGYNMVSLNCASDMEAAVDYALIVAENKKDAPYIDVHFSPDDPVHDAGNASWEFKIEDQLVNRDLDMWAELKEREKALEKKERKLIKKEIKLYEMKEDMKRTVAEVVREEMGAFSAQVMKKMAGMEKEMEQAKELALLLGEKYLMSSNTIPFSERYVLAEKYGMNELKEEYLNQITSVQQAKNVGKSKYFTTLPQETRDKIKNELLERAEQQEQKIKSLPYPSGSQSLNQTSSLIGEMPYYPPSLGPMGNIISSAFGSGGSHSPAAPFAFGQSPVFPSQQSGLFDHRAARSSLFAPYPAQALPTAVDEETIAKVKPTAASSPSVQNLSTKPSTPALPSPAAMQQPATPMQSTPSSSKATSSSKKSNSSSMSSETKRPATNNAAANSQQLQNQLAQLAQLARSDPMAAAAMMGMGGGLMGGGDSAQQQAAATAAAMSYAPMMQQMQQVQQQQQKANNTNAANAAKTSSSTSSSTSAAAATAASNNNSNNNANATAAAQANMAMTMLAQAMQNANRSNAGASSNSQMAQANSQLHALAQFAALSQQANALQGSSASKAFGNNPQLLRQMQQLVAEQMQKNAAKK